MEHQACVNSNPSRALFWMLWDTKPILINLDAESPEQMLFTTTQHDTSISYHGEFLLLSGGIVTREFISGWSDENTSYHHISELSCDVANLCSGPVEKDNPIIRYPDWNTIATRFPKSIIAEVADKLRNSKAKLEEN